MHAKVVLVGASGSGKTSFYAACRGAVFNPNRPATVGVEYTRLERNNIVIGLWDTSGAERFRSISSAYYRRASAALLFYDMSKPPSVGSLGVCVDDLRNVVPSVHVYIVGSKNDIKCPNAHELLQNAAVQLGIEQVFTISSTSRDGVELLIDSLSNYMSTHIGDLQDQPPVSVCPEDPSVHVPRKEGGCCH